MKTVVLAIALLGCAAPLFAQRDFLTADEIDRVRLTAQDPNARLKLYLEFARQRLDQIKTLVKDNQPGRAGMIHDLIDQYSQIIDAIDTVADDALQRKLDIAEGTKAVASAEKEFLPALKKVRDSKPADLARYEFVLDQAIDSTQDSLDASLEDLGARAAEVQARNAEEQKQLESMMQPKDLEAKKAAEAKQKEQEAKDKKKPTLLKPGETVKKQY
jgi:hypothetical protein